MINHFKTLGVSIDAEDVVIRAAWVAMLKRHHPDVDPSAGAAERTRQINEAFNVLRNDEDRRKHRADLVAWLEAQRRRAMAFSHEAASARPSRSDQFANEHALRTRAITVARKRSAPSVFTWSALLIIAYVAIQVFSVLSGVNNSAWPATGTADATPPALTPDKQTRYETVEAYQRDGRSYLRSVDYPSLEELNKARIRDGRRPLDVANKP